MSEPDNLAQFFTDSQYQLGQTSIVTPAGIITVTIEFEPHYTGAEE